jgi:anti-anti-sigma factor
MVSDTIKMPKKFNYSCINDFNEQFSKTATSAKTIYLDCENLEYIDSAGIGILVMTQKKSKALSIRLVITRLSDSIKDVLELANLQKIIEFK